MKNEIAFFSGSFNPIHTGHLILANYIKEFTYIDEVWFIVSPHNPLKDSGGILDDDIRLEMTRLALKEYSDFKLSDIEFGMPRPSYTIDTLEKLTIMYPDSNFTLIIGADNWSVFSQWKDYKRITKNFRIIIYPRKGHDILIPEEFKKSIIEVDAPLVEVSSTFIRNSIKEGKNMRAFLPPKVFDFIVEKGLYL